MLTVVPTIERFDLVRAFERSYSETAPPEEPAVFVVMGPDDGTADFLASRQLASRPYTVHRPARVLAFAEAINQGVKAGLEANPFCDVVIVGNDDIVLQPGWYEALAEAIEGGMDIVGAKLLYPPGRDALPDAPRKIQHFGKWFTLDFFPFHVLRGMPETHEKAAGVMFCPDVTFAWAAVRREVWEKLGGLDEGYHGGFEDDDFCLRAKELGCLIGVHSGFLALHRESATTGQDNENKARQWARFSQEWVESGRIQWPLGMLQGWRS